MYLHTSESVSSHTSSREHTPKVFSHIIIIINITQMGLKSDDGTPCKLKWNRQTRKQKKKHTNLNRLLHTVIRTTTTIYLLSDGSHLVFVDIYFAFPNILRMKMRRIRIRAKQISRETLSCVLFHVNHRTQHKHFVYFAYMQMSIAVCTLQGKL